MPLGKVGYLRTHTSLGVDLRRLLAILRRDTDLLRHLVRLALVCWLWDHIHAGEVALILMPHHHVGVETFFLRFHSLVWTSV